MFLIQLHYLYILIHHQHPSTRNIMEYHGIFTQIHPLTANLQDMFESSPMIFSFVLTLNSIWEVHFILLLEGLNSAQKGQNRVWCLRGKWTMQSMLKSSKLFPIVLLSNKKLVWKLDVFFRWYVCGFYHAKSLIKPPFGRRLLELFTSASDKQIQVRAPPQCQALLGIKLHSIAGLIFRDYENHHCSGHISQRGGHLLLTVQKSGDHHLGCIKLRT